MKKTNYKLPGLPSISSTPKNPGKATPLRDSSMTKSAALTSKSAKPLSFGKAPHTATKVSQSTSSWSHLLSQTTSGGLAGTVSGSFGFGGGIGSLITGIASLFGGGKTTPPALVAYQLPASQQETISIGSSVPNTGMYGGPSSAALFESQSGQIVKSVRQALLNSSSLNDVIAEL
jgi:hypothetical protein